MPNGAAIMWQCHSKAGNEAGRAIQIQLDYAKSSQNVSQIFEYHCHMVVAPFGRVSVEFECKTQTLERLHIVYCILLKTSRMCVSRL